MLSSARLRRRSRAGRFRTPLQSDRACILAPDPKCTRTTGPSPSTGRLASSPASGRIADDRNRQQLVQLLLYEPVGCASSESATSSACENSPVRYRAAIRSGGRRRSSARPTMSTKQGPANVRVARLRPQAVRSSALLGPNNRLLWFSAGSISSNISSNAAIPKR
jgi:hypothetical protein